MKNIKKFKKTKKRKIIIFSTSGVLLLVIVVGVVLIIFLNHGSAVYKGLLVGKGKIATIDLNSLKIGKTNNTLKGKNLTVSGGTISYVNTDSKKFSGNLLTIIHFKLFIPIPPGNNKLDLDYTIQENTKKDLITVTAITDGLSFNDKVYYALPLS